MSDPQEVATPSDPHSAEAEARYPDPPPPTPWDYMSPPEEVRERERDAFIAGRVSRDAEVAELRAEKERWHDAALIGLAQESAARSEVAELKAKIAAAVARLNAASIPPMMTEAQFNATTITDARRILLGSASPHAVDDQMIRTTVAQLMDERDSWSPESVAYALEKAIRLTLDFGSASFPVEGGN